MSRLLVADDDEPMRITLAKLLARIGHEVLVAREGNECLQLVMTSQLDLIITDFHMPGPSGLRLLSEINRLQPGLPIIVITGDHEVETLLAQSKPESPINVLYKPFEPSSLVARINEIPTGRRNPS